MQYRILRNLKNNSDLSLNLNRYCVYTLLATGCQSTSEKPNILLTHKPKFVVKEHGFSV